MKKIPALFCATLIVALLHFTTSLLAQDSLTFKINTGFADKTLRDLMSFQGVEQQELEITGSKLRGKPSTCFLKNLRTGW